MTQRKKKIIFIIVISLILGYGKTRTHSYQETVGRGESWQKIVIESGPGLEAVMPAFPRHTIGELNMGGMKTKTASFISEDERGRTYVLSVIVLPEGARLEKGVFQAVLTALLTSAETRPAVFEEKGDQAEFKIISLSGGRATQGRMIRNGNFMVLQSISYPEGLFPLANYQRFIQSFFWKNDSIS